MGLFSLRTAATLGVMLSMALQRGVFDSGGLATQARLHEFYSSLGESKVRRRPSKNTVAQSLRRGAAHPGCAESRALAPPFSRGGLSVCLLSRRTV